MNALKVIGIVLLSVILIALFALVLFPGFMIMEMLIGMEPVIITIALLILGFILGLIIDNPYLEKIMGYLLGSTILGVIIFYILGGPTSSVPIWIILVITLAISIPAFLTSMLKNIPFIGEKLIPPIWLISIFTALMIILSNTVEKS